MKSDRLFVTLTLLTLLCATTGCARWSLWPRPAMDATQPGSPAPQPAPAQPAAPAQPRISSSLLQAVGLDRSAQQNQQALVASQEQQQQQTNDDLKQLDPVLALARLAERQGDPNEARRQYLRYIENHPNHPLPHHRLGVMAARDSKFQEAEAHMQRAAQMARPSAELLSDLGYLCFLQDRLPEAEHLLQQASQIEPSNQMVNNNLAKVMAAKGDFDNSLRHFRKVNDEAQARANLAYTHSQQGDLEKARQEYLRALTLDNTLSSAAKALVQVEEARKREQTAISNMQAALGDELIDSQAQAQAGQARNGQASRLASRNITLPSEVAHEYPAVTVSQTTPHRLPAVPAGQAAARQALAQQHMLMQVPSPSDNNAYVPPPSDDTAYVPPPRRHEESPRYEVPPVQAVAQPAGHGEPANTSPALSSFAGDQTADANVTAASSHDWHNAWQHLSQTTAVPQPQQASAAHSSPAKPDAFEALGGQRSRFTAPVQSAQKEASVGLSNGDARPMAKDDASYESSGISISIGDE